MNPETSPKTTQQAEVSYGLGFIETASPPRLVLGLYTRAERLINRALGDLSELDALNQEGPNLKRARQYLQQAHAVLMGLSDLLSTQESPSLPLLQTHESLSARLSNQFRQPEPAPAELRTLLTEIRLYRTHWEQALAIRPRTLPALNVRQAGT